MIKQGLKANSKSNGRELQYTILSLQNENIENKFQDFIESILERKSLYPNKKSGLTRFNILFETYIKKAYKEYRTINVFARQLNSDNFIPFWNKLKKLVKANSHIFQGRLEPHPADREISSWHIQYTGANCDFVEKVLGAFVVKEGAEISMEMALGHNEKPHYLKDDNLPIKNIEDELLAQELINTKKYLSLDMDIQNAQEIINKHKPSTTRVQRKSSDALRDELNSLKKVINIKSRDKVLNDIRRRKSDRARNIINNIKNKS